ncbi:MAG: GDSL-type esterase/lipase family protein [Candidatus Saccharimonas aalborgensis]
MILKRVVFLAATIGLIAVTFGYCAFAEGLDWTQGKFTVASAVERPASQQERVVDCSDTTIQYKEYDTDEIKQIEACVTAGDGVQIAHSISSGRYYIATPTSGTFVALQFYGHMSLIPGTTRVILDINSELYIVYNILAHLDSYPSWDTHRIYSLNLAERDFPAAGVQQGITRYGISRNGRYVVYNAGDSYGVPGKLIRYDMETKENRVFGASPYSSIYSGYPVAALGVSDDGSTVVAGGSTDLKFWHITDSCLGPTEPQGPMNGYDTCAHKLYSQSDYGLIQGPDAWYPRTDDFHFDETGTELQFGYHGGASVQRTVTLYAPGHVDDRVDYLALGDSYSSGEGDTELQPNGNLKYYRNHTDDNGYSVVGGDLILNRPIEKCHISTRSYPYILATGMELGTAYNTLPTKWQSVACSGATAWDVKEQGADDYTGQGDRLKGYDYGTLKAQALNEFIPGRQKQIEFVKKYQPKVITLTMGGNDVDFGGKINICVRKIETCDYATTQWREKMKNELIGQFENLSSLYSELSAASVNKAKVYVLGYPIFINGNPYAKCTNTFNLDSSEREFINNSIIYMNNIIEQAAKKAGVKYINIENAFGNHRLCDTGSQHVTAVTNIFGANGNEQQEGFHPNHFGHVDIANAVWDAVGGQSLLNYQTCSDASVKVCPDNSVTAADAVVPPYFTEGVPSDDTEIHYYTLTNGTLVKMTETLDLNSGKYKFASETKVDITLYSDPTSLGQVTAASDGTASAKITIPSSVPAGYHTLVMRGIGTDGKPLELYQTVEVRGPNPNDIDEDGVDDSVDRCAYITPLNIDADHDGIDDACDPEVNVPEAPVAPEKDNHLYLERRVNTTTPTGMSGDNDPDGDGWAIVGVSSDRAYVSLLLRASQILHRMLISPSVAMIRWPLLHQLVPLFLVSILVLATAAA